MGIKSGQENNKKRYSRESSGLSIRTPWIWVWPELQNCIAGRELFRGPLYQSIRPRKGDFGDPKGERKIFFSFFSYFSPLSSALTYALALEIHCYCADDGIGSYIPWRLGHTILSLKNPWVLNHHYLALIIWYLKDGPSHVELCDSTVAKFLRETVFSSRGAGVWDLGTGNCGWNTEEMRAGEAGVLVLCTII